MNEWLTIEHQGRLTMREAERYARRLQQLGYRATVFPLLAGLATVELRNPARGPGQRLVAVLRTAEECESLLTTDPNHET